MGETLNNLRAKYPEYDSIPDAELAGKVIQKYPEYGKTDLMDTARNYLVKSGGVLETPQQGKLADWYQNLKSGISSQFSQITGGAKALGSDVAADVKAVPDNLRAITPRVNVDEEGNVSGQTMFGASPVGTALGIGQQEGRTAGLAELSKWLLPGKMGGMVGERGLPGAATRGATEAEAAGVRVAGPGPAFEAGPAGQAGRLGQTPALPAHVADRGSIIQQGKRASAVGEEVYAPRPVRPNTADVSPYDLTPAQTAEVMPKPGPANEVAPSALDIANQRAPLSSSESAVGLPNKPGLVTPTGQDVGNIGRTFWDNRGSVDPQVAYTAARTAAGATAGAYMGDTGIDKLRYGIAGGLLGMAGPKLAGMAMGAWRQPALGINSSDMAVSMAKWKTRAGAFFTPEDIAKGIAPATNIVREGFATADVQHQIEKGFLSQLKDIYGPIAKDPESIQSIHRALDGQPVMLTPAQAQIAQRVRSAFNDMADRAQLPQQKRLADYFPHVRDEVNSTLKLELSGGGERPIGKDIPQDYRVFYEKPRTATDTSTIDFGMGPVQAYAKAAAKRIAIKGGTDLEGETVPGFINRVGPHLQSLPEVPELQNYFKDYVNDMVSGAPRAKYSLLTPQQASTIKHVEFLRTIGLNLMSPVSNLTQTLNTFAVTDARSWGAAWYDIFRNPEVMDLARKSGVVSQDLSKADIVQMANPDKLNALLQKGTEVGGWLFKQAEETNRLHAFAAGYRDAQRSGLTGVDAVQYAKNIVNQTQFRFGMENAPRWMRGGNPDASVIGQYKSYQMNQMLFLKNLVTSNPVGAIKYAIGTALIAGPDTITGSTLGHTIRGYISQAFGGDPKDYKFRGALGEMGIYLGNQLGMGALPAENLSGLFFLLPGPALSHIMDIASVVSGRNLNPTALADGTFGTKLTPEQFASKATSSVNVQGNRLRQAAVMGRTEGPNTRQPRDLSEAFAVSPPTGVSGRPMEPSDALKKAVGVPSQAANDAFDTKSRLIQEIKDYHDLVSKKAMAIRAGDIEEVKRLNALGIRQFGRLPVTNMNTMQRAAEQANVPATERIERHAPRPIRSYIRQEGQD